MVDKQMEIIGEKSAPSTMPEKNEKDEVEMSLPDLVDPDWGIGQLHGCNMLTLKFKFKTRKKERVYLTKLKRVQR